MSMTTSTLSAKPLHHLCGPFQASVGSLFVPQVWSQQKLMKECGPAHTVYPPTHTKTNHFWVPADCAQPVWINSTTLTCRHSHLKYGRCLLFHCTSPFSAWAHEMPEQWARAFHVTCKYNIMNEQRKTYFERELFTTVIWESLSNLMGFQVKNQNFSPILESYHKLTHNHLIF
jgi:hypothetical protein